jgi:ABC-type Fe3+/spermidine/putrescine transport system ATPase subunit
MFRPEHLSITAPGGTALQGIIETMTFLGPALRLRIALGGGERVLVDCPSGHGNGALRRGEPIGLRADPDHAVLLSEPASP